MNKEGVIVGDCDEAKRVNMSEFFWASETSLEKNRLDLLKHSGHIPLQEELDRLFHGRSHLVNALS